MTEELHIPQGQVVGEWRTVGGDKGGLEGRGPHIREAVSALMLSDAL